MELDAGTRVDGRYVVEARLGAGGMGTVYRVRHTGLGTLHALKVLRTAGEKLRRRLLDEGRLQGALSHPGVVRVTDLVEVDGHPALVLELVRGRSLAEHLVAERFDAADVDRIARSLFDAVAAAHAHGLVHRDLKPGNILMEPVDGRLVPRVTDFGLAKALDSETDGLTATGTTLGTPAYMAPEQYRDAARVDTRADVFSLGAILYELVTGRRAFDGPSAHAIMWKASEGAFTPPRDVVDLPVAWEQAIVAALSPDPDARPSSVEELRAIWTGQAPRTLVPRSPTVSEPETWTDDTLHPATEAHPSLADLHAGDADASVQAHLATCAACRVELRLYREAFAEMPPTPGWRAPLAGLGVGLVFTPVIGAVLLTADHAIELLGPWWVPLLALGGVSGAALARAAVRARAGRVGGPLAWFGAPALLLAVGLIGAWLGASTVDEVIWKASVAVTPRLGAMGACVALSAWSAGQVLAMTVVVLVLTSLVIGRRGDRIGFDAVPVAVAIVGGALLWLAEALAAPDQIAGAAAFLTVALCAAHLGALPTGRPGDADARFVGALATVAAGGSAAMVVRLEAYRSLLYDAVKVNYDALGAVAQVTGSWSVMMTPWVLAWAGLAAAVGAVSVARAPGWRDLRLGRWGGELALLAVVVGVPGTLAVAKTHAVAIRLIPGFYAAAIAEAVPTLRLEAAEALVVCGHADAPLVEGDRVLAVGDRTVHTQADVHALVVECACPAECDVGCIGDPVPVTVDRDGRKLEVALPR